MTTLGLSLYHHITASLPSVALGIYSRLVPRSTHVRFHYICNASFINPIWNSIAIRVLTALSSLHRTPSLGCTEIIKLLFNNSTHTIYSTVSVWRWRWASKVDRILLRFDHMMWLLCDKVCYSCDDHGYSSTIRWDCKCGMRVCNQPDPSEPWSGDGVFDTKKLSPPSKVLKQKL